MRFRLARSIDQFPCFSGESIYAGLGGIVLKIRRGLAKNRLNDGMDF